MPIQKTLLPIERSANVSDLHIDYINGKKELEKFYSYRPDQSSLLKAIKDISTFKFDRKTLVDAITNQYASSGVKPPSSVNRLSENNTYTVCTGHQLCLFTGPLYFIYKLISTINLAESLKKEDPTSNFIPVYWMASEDHDFEEVDHVTIFGKKIK